MSSSEEQEIPQTFRYMTVLDVVPGRAFSEEWTPNQPVPKEGEKMAVITFGYEGEVEQPIMLSLPDATKLSLDLLNVLAHHGIQFAKSVLEELFPEQASYEQDEDDEDDGLHGEFE